MAIAKSTTQTITVSTITLELSEDEAKLLLVILGRIGGPSETSLRGGVDKIYRELRKVIGHWRIEDALINDLLKAIYFKDGTSFEDLKQEDC